MQNPHAALFLRRTLVAGLGVVCGMGILAARYGYLQIYQHDKYLTNSDNNRIKLISSPPTRGYIYDRNGIILADNLPVYAAILSPDEVEEPARTLALLAPIFELSDEDVADILSRIDKDKKNPITIKIAPNDAQIAAFLERKPFFRGVTIDTKLTRAYPHGALFAHILGYVGRINDKEAKKINENEADKLRYAGTDLIGKLGLEKQYEDLLLGQPGFESVETNAYGDVLRHLDTRAPIKGNDIHLSLDYGLQKKAHKLLKGHRGAIVAIEPDTGEILAFASNPTFDPNPFVSGISSKAYRALRENPDQPLYNRALQGQYPPASTIKPFEAMGILHYGLMGWHDTIFDPGYFSLPNDSHKFRDWKKGGHGTVNMTTSLTQSVDTYYYKLSYQMGIERLHDWMVQFGFGKKTGIDLPSEKTGVMPSPAWKQKTYKKDWLPGDTISVSIGQGYFLATPLQIAQATATTARQGKIITPHLLKKTDGAHAPSTPVQQGFIAFNGDGDNWEKLHSAMEATVKSGTAKGIYTSEYRMAGKTGTAQVKSIAQGKSYNKALLDKRHWDHAWFIGFAPVQNPKIALAVLIENGGGGGKVAAPIARQLFDYWLLERGGADGAPMPYTLTQADFADVGDFAAPTDIAPPKDTQSDTKKDAPNTKQPVPLLTRPQNQNPPTVFISPFAPKSS